jgi:hypothetical protein
MKKKRKKGGPTMYSMNPAEVNAVPMNGYRPKFAIFHPNPKGTGCAMMLDLLPASGVKDGCIFATLANQKSVGSRDGGRITYPTFDWENRLCVKFDFNDLCRFLQVLRGECESIEEGKGLYHTSSEYATRITFRHQVEPMNGYSLDVHRKTDGSPDVKSSAHIFLSPAEALGLGILFENSIGYICFGVPEPVDAAGRRAWTGKESAHA